jgi:ABC-type lipoprotein release transport system permease subunit
VRLLTLASRNLLRNKRRTGITLAAIAVGLAYMFFAATLVAGMTKTGFDTAISSQAGHVVLQAEGWQDERKPTLVVEGAGALTSSLQEAYPDGVVAPRIYLGGLVTSPTTSARVALTGLDPDAERQVQDLHEDVVEGEWLGVDDREIVIGHALADALAVEVGDKLVYMGQHGTDEVTSRLFRVRGIFRTGAATIDGRMAYAHLGAAREFLGGGDVAHMVTLHLDDPGRAEEAAARIEGSLGRPGLDVRTWREALPDLVTLMEFTSVSTDMLVFVLGVLVAFGVLNTVLMSTLERTREFGVMRALGMRPRQTARLVLMEGMVLGVFGAAVGLALGLPCSWYLVENGLDYAAMGMGETMETGGVVIDSLIMGAWDPVRIAAYCVGAVLFCVLAAAYPAWSISRLPPVKALRVR